jgi:tripartite-type tricarboxylate transporter receptor subunit TctC
MRSDVLPSLPTVGDFLPGFEAGTWFGVGAPNGTRSEIVQILNKGINTVLSDPSMRTHIADLGGTVIAGAPSDLAKLIADETEKWGKVIRAAGIKTE